MNEDTELFINPFAKPPEKKSNKTMICYRIAIIISLLLILILSVINTGFSIRFYQKVEKVESDLTTIFGNNFTRNREKSKIRSKIWKKKEDGNLLHPFLYCRLHCQEHSKRIYQR